MFMFALYAAKSGRSQLVDAVVGVALKPVALEDRQRLRAWMKETRALRLLFGAPFTTAPAYMAFGVLAGCDVT